MRGELDGIECQVKNENGERLLEIYADQELVASNSWFKKMFAN